MSPRPPSPEQAPGARHRRGLLTQVGVVGAGVVVVVIVAVTVHAMGGTGPEASTAELLDPRGALPITCDGGVTPVHGPQESAFRDVELAPGAVIDARGATWAGLDANGSPIRWTITLDGVGGGCWLGGQWHGAWDDRAPDVSWEDPYHHAGLITLRLPNFSVVGIRAGNHGDGIRVTRRAQGFHVDGAYLSDIHDDCVENDYMLAGTVRNSLFDGCYVAFSAARHSGIDDPADGATWGIRGNLVRLEAQPTTYSGPSPGHGPLFKWTEGGPTVDLVDNVFRVDQAPNHGSLGIPDHLELGACSGNVVVWGGVGPYPDPLPDCFRVTTDLGVWTQAVAAWCRIHEPDVCPVLPTLPPFQPADH